MRKRLLILALALFAVLQTAWAYDFSATSPSGHTLYYEIISGTTNVGVVRPGTVSTYDNYVTGNVVIPATVTYGGTTYNVTGLHCISYADAGLFENCSGLTSVTIPNSVIYIERKAFYNCSGLTSVTIPNSVNSIGSSAFQECTGLTSVTIPNSVTHIDKSAFSYCNNLRTLNFNAINCNYSNYIYYLSDLPFYNSPITTINIGDSVQQIPTSFAYDLESLNTVTIGNSVTSIGGWAFYNCSGLTSVTIPNSVTSIGDWAFSGCSGLTSITIPNSVTSIGEGVFTDCGHLASATISSGINRIEESTFENCTSLVTITIPSNVANIEDKAFNGCSSLHEVISLAVLPPSLGEEIFSTTVILKVPCGSADYYNSAASDWTQYFVGIEEICNVTITVTSANESMGTVSGGGEYEVGTEITITAIPNEGYRFVSWNDGNTDNPRTITVTEDATYIATFEEGEEVIRYTITVLSANESMGTVSGGGEYEVGTEVTITATPNEGYHFVSWNDGNTDNPRTITVTEDATYIATFEEGVGIESRDMLSELTFYPNPTSGIITLSRTDVMKVEVIDAVGKTIMVVANNHVLDLSKLTKGYYTLRITLPEGVAIRKVIRK